jgi:hypothetical protein
LALLLTRMKLIHLRTFLEHPVRLLKDEHPTSLERSSTAMCVRDRWRGDGMAAYKHHPQSLLSFFPK